MVQPAARAGAILRACSVIGKFHGLMAPTTPTGCLIVRCRLPGAELRDDLAVGPLALLGEPLEGVGRVQDLGLGLGERLALLHRQGAGDGVGPLAHQVGGLLEDLGPVVGGRLHPGRHRLRGRLDGPASVLPAAVGDLGDDLFGRRVDDVDGFRAGHPLPSINMRVSSGDFMEID